MLTSVDLRKQMLRDSRNSNTPQATPTQSSNYTVLGFKEQISGLSSPAIQDSYASTFASPWKPSPLASHQAPTCFVEKPEGLHLTCPRILLKPAETPCTICRDPAKRPMPQRTHDPQTPTVSPAFYVVIL